MNIKKIKKENINHEIKNEMKKEMKIDNIKNLDELREAFELFTRTFKGDICLENERHSFDFIKKEYLNNPDLYLKASIDDTIVGFLSSRIDDKKMTLSILCVEQNIKKSGIGSSLVRKIEEIAKDKGINKIQLGAVDSAINFYKKLGYKNFLLIQSLSLSIDELLLFLNDKYKVLGTNIYSDEFAKNVSQVYIELDDINDKLQEDIGNKLEKTYSQMVFYKVLKICKS